MSTISPKAIAAAAAKEHHLKTWPEFYQQIESGVKTFEVRREDRGFAVGDLLVLEEYDFATGKYTGRETTRVVTSILPGPAFGIQEGFCVMSIAPEPAAPPESQELEEPWKPWWVNRPWKVDGETTDCVRCGTWMSLREDCEWDDEETHFNLCNDCVHIVLHESLERFSAFAASQQKERDDLKRWLTASESQASQATQKVFALQADLRAAEATASRQAGVIEELRKVITRKDAEASRWSCEALNQTHEIERLKKALDGLLNYRDDGEGHEFMLAEQVARAALGGCGDIT